MILPREGGRTAVVTKDEKKIVVVEANEIPLRIFRRYAERYPNSTIARLLKDSLVTETMATDVSEASLYPSQTWASLNTGVPYEKHRIYFYNDNKAADYPFYWEIVANQGYSVGLVSSLHSSPAKRYAQSPGIKFLIPDCFAEDDQTKPHLFEVFQRVNLKHTDANKRVAS